MSQQRSDLFDMLVPATKTVTVAVEVGTPIGTDWSWDRAREVTPAALEYLHQMFPEACQNMHGIIDLKDLWRVPVDAELLTEQERAFVEATPHLRQITSRESIEDYTEESKERYRAAVKAFDAAQQASARYYLCYFRQEPESIITGAGGAPITQRFVHQETFAPDEQAQADARANKLEQEHYARKDFNVRIVARLAASLEDAKKGHFLDE
jgi:hypothetical protein